MVGLTEWRTGKTMDLLRILALNNGRAVPTSSVIEHLWPGAPEDRARASLRTAASQVRHTLRASCIARHTGTLTLTDAWVDVSQFKQAARLAARAAHEGRHTQVIDLTEIAERLYRGDFHAYNDEAAWVVAERNHLRTSRRTMLCEAADAAIAIGNYAAAVEFATKAVTIDPTFEAAYRALMVAYSGLGEVASALRAYEEFRTRLADELGADPSLKTQALHLRLLRGEAAG